MAYTQTAEKKPVARLFCKTVGGTGATSGNLARLTDAEVNAIVTSGVVATGWAQIYTAGGAEYMKGRTTTDITNDQLGIVDVSVDEETSTFKITVSSTGLAELRDLNAFNLGNTGFSSGTAAFTGWGSRVGLGDKESRGASMINNGLSFFVYNKNEDPDNETNTPAFTADDFTFCIFNAVPTTEAGMKWTQERDTITLEYRCLASRSTGSAKGYKAVIGSFVSA